MPVGPEQRSRQKLPTVDDFKTSANYATNKKAVFKKADARRTLLDEIVDQLGKANTASKVDIVDYLGALDTLKALCQRYLDSQGVLKKMKMGIGDAVGRGGKSRSILAVESLRANAIQRKTDIEQSIAEYNSSVEMKTVAFRPVGGLHDQRLHHGKGLVEHEFNELVIEDARARRALIPDKPAITGMVSAATARGLQKELTKEVVKNLSPDKSGPVVVPKTNANVKLGGYWQLRHMVKHYPNFLTGAVGEAVPQLDYLRTQVDRDPYRVNFDQTQNPTRLMTSGGQPFNTAPDCWTYAVDNATGEFYSKLGGRDVSHHSTFFAGMPVMCAGDIKIVNGQLKWITNTSGHYRPSRENLYDALLFLRDQWQVALNNVWVLLQVGDDGDGEAWVCPALVFMQSLGQPPNQYKHKPADAGDLIRTK